MEKVYFIFGYQGRYWGEYGSGTSFTIKGIVEINSEDPIDVIIQSILDMFRKKIASKKLEKNISFGGSGDLGGSSTTFYSSFFSEKGNTGFIREITKKLESRLGEVFDLEYKNI